jgi:hypothetical protein
VKAMGEKERRESNKRVEEKNPLTSGSTSQNFEVAPKPNRPTNNILTFRTL